MQSIHTIQKNNNNSSLMGAVHFDVPPHTLSESAFAVSLIKKRKKKKTKTHKKRHHMVVFHPPSHILPIAANPSAIN